MLNPSYSLLQHSNQMRCKRPTSGGQRLIYLSLTWPGREHLTQPSGSLPRQWKAHLDNDNNNNRIRGRHQRILHRPCYLSPKQLP